MVISLTHCLCCAATLPYIESGVLCRDLTHHTDYMSKTVIQYIYLRLSSNSVVRMIKQLLLVQVM
jgi:hypothetical protein